MSCDNIREQILRGAQKLFQQSGLGKITMEDIARIIGKGKSTLYYYFKSKEEIFAAVLDMEINEIITETVRQTSSFDSILDKLKVFGKVKCEMTRKRKSLYRTMENVMDWEELQQYAKIKKNIHAVYVQKEKVVLQQIFMGAMMKHEISRMADVDLDNTIMVLLCGFRGINREIYRHGQDIDAIRLINIFCQTFLYGIR